MRFRVIAALPGPCPGPKSSDKILREAADVPQRRPQIVGHGIGKSFQLMVGGRQLRGTLHYPLFQFFIQLANFPLVRFSLRDVTESHYATPHRAVLVFQGAAANLNPGPLLELRVAHKHLGSTRLSRGWREPGEADRWEKV